MTGWGMWDNVETAGFKFSEAIKEILLGVTPLPGLAGQTPLGHSLVDTIDRLLC